MQEEPRVVTRRQIGGAGEERRRLYQRHLAAFLVVNLLGVGADVVMSPGIQFWHWVLVFWGVVFLVHTFGLVSRGYTVTDLVTPSRPKKRVEEDAPPLEYELIKSRQLRDGIVRAAAAVREREPAAVDEATDAANAVTAAVERLVDAARAASLDQHEDGRSEIQPQLQTALERLDALHDSLIRMSVFEAPAEEVLPSTPAREHADALDRMAEGIGGTSARNA